MENNQSPFSKTLKPPHPGLNFLLESASRATSKKGTIEQKDEELEEELKDNIHLLDINPVPRKVSRIVNKNPYSILQQPIIKRFSNPMMIRDSLSPRTSSNIKSEQYLSGNSFHRSSEFTYPIPHGILDEPTNRNRNNSKIENEDGTFSIYNEGKSRNSMIVNLDDYLSNFSAKIIGDLDRHSSISSGSRRKQQNDQVEADFNESLLKGINESESFKEERKVLYDYLMDFMVMSLNENDDNNEDDNFMLDEEGEKLQKE